MAEKLYAVLLSRRDSRGEWMIRNSRLSFGSVLSFGKLRDMTEVEVEKYAQKEIDRWRAYEHHTEFKVVRVPYGHEYLR